MNISGDRDPRCLHAGLTAAAFICLMLMLSPGAAAESMSMPDPQILRRTSLGEIVGMPGSGGSLSWLGVPYAEPPVGAWRWRAPRPSRTWAGQFKADQFGSRCPQRDPSAGPQLRSIGSEDCLFLNIWTPLASSDSDSAHKRVRPVMVWIHSGANVSRAGSDFDGGKLAVRGDVVVVTINYRLGALGWFLHSALQSLASSPEDASGNFGTLDQIEALRWVRRHIAAFGGDPRNVTLFGESAGGWNIYALLASRQTKGLFHRAIIQSGNMPFYTPAQASNARNAADPGVIKNSGEVTLQLLVDSNLAADLESARRHVAGMADREVADFLRSKSYLDFLHAEQALYSDWARSAAVIGQLRYLPGLIRDGRVLPAESFLETAARGAIRRVPILAGSNRDEDIEGLVLYGPQLMQRLGAGRYRFREPEFVAVAVEYLGKLWKADGVDRPAELLSKDRPVFVYRFDWDEQERTPSITIVGGSIGAMHGAHVPFLFGTPSIELDDATRASFDALSDATMSYWSEFAHNGDPGRGREGRLPRWPQWQLVAGDAPAYLLLDSAADGGIRPKSGLVTVQSVLDEIRHDPRMPNLASRCRLYYEIANFAFGANYRMGRLAPADYLAVEDGQCALRHPLSPPAHGAQVPPPGTTFRDCPNCPRMVVVPAGSFEMGAAAGTERSADEQPRHSVRFSSPYAMGAHEVTRGQFEEFVAATGYDAGNACHLLVDGAWALTQGRSWRDPGFEQADDHPVVCVSWEDARAYVAWLARETGLRYRLPSESEWEFAARAGSTGDFSWDGGPSHEFANYGKEACCGPLRMGRDRWDYTAPVGSFAPNAFGLYDDRGNAWEWLLDCYHASYDGAPADGSARKEDCSLPDRRGVRGGGWGDGSPLLRAAYRLRGPMNGRYFTLGFRVAKDFGN